MYVRGKKLIEHDSRKLDIPRNSTYISFIFLTFFFYKFYCRDRQADRQRLDLLRQRGVRVHIDTGRAVSIAPRLQISFGSSIDSARLKRSKSAYRGLKYKRTNPYLAVLYVYRSWVHYTRSYIVIGGARTLFAKKIVFLVVFVVFSSGERVFSKIHPPIWSKCTKKTTPLPTGFIFKIVGYMPGKFWRTG